MSNNTNFNSFFSEAKTRQQELDKLYSGDINKSYVSDFAVDIYDEIGNIIQKSFSSDLKDKWPEGVWRTINGSKVFINNGKVVAGLSGFNGMIDQFFSEKKNEESGGKDENEISGYIGKDFYVFKKHKDGFYRGVSNTNDEKKTYSKNVLGDILKERSSKEEPKYGKNNNYLPKEPFSIEFEKYSKGSGEWGEATVTYDRNNFIYKIETKDGKKAKMGEKDLQEKINEGEYAIIKKQKLISKQESSKEDKFVKDGYRITRATINDKPMFRISHPDGKVSVIPDRGYSLEEVYETAKLNKESSKKKEFSYKKEKDKFATKEYIKKTPDGLGQFREIAKTAKDVQDFISKVREIKGVPAEVSNAFGEKYSEGGKLSMEKTTEKFMNEVKNSPSKEKQPMKEAAKVTPEAQRKIASLKEFSDKIASLKRKSIRDPKTTEYDNETFKQLIDSYNSIDMDSVSQTQKNKISDIIDDIDLFVDRTKFVKPEEKGKRGKWVKDEAFEEKLKDLDTLPQKIDYIHKELIKEIKGGNEFISKHGEMSDPDEYLNNAKDLIEEIAKEYVTKQATEALNYKLF